MLLGGLTSNAKNMPINSARVEGQSCMQAPICVLLCVSIKAAPPLKRPQRFHPVLDQGARVKSATICIKL
ncbi:hypothetical protein RirG_271620 [Rhizophagus irregularis DAOM 197198w]|uniref:Uncharacterized protein n=1 Tax=Rhizophagus irregularis (strain DAOM 197198w) TaxID=1432141 RepID=A0A015I099_RHIIW|nr:hypothetical protein RirG_271620 [Rhizophagus irregularis DAOM 197198w]